MLPNALDYQSEWCHKELLNENRWSGKQNHSRPHCVCQFQAFSQTRGEINNRLGVEPRLCSVQRPGEAMAMPPSPFQSPLCMKKQISIL